MRKALIVWGGWSGHEPEQCADIVRSWLEEDGFEVRVETTPEAFGEPAVALLDLVVPIVSMSTIRREDARSLSKAVEDGVGLAGFHGGLGDSFRDCVEYQFMVGGQWVAHPGNIVDYEVEIIRPDDPIMDGISRFHYHSEQYYMHVDPSNEVLAVTTFNGDHAWWIDGVRVPVVWKRHHGRGRVFYSSLGHVSAELSHSEMSTLLRRGLNWAARA